MLEAGMLLPATATERVNDEPEAGVNDEPEAGVLLPATATERVNDEA